MSSYFLSGKQEAHKVSSLEDLKIIGWSQVYQWQVSRCFSLYYICNGVRWYLNIQFGEQLTLLVKTFRPEKLRSLQFLERFLLSYTLHTSLIVELIRKRSFYFWLDRKSRNFFGYFYVDLPVLYFVFGCRTNALDLANFTFLIDFDTQYM